MQKRIIIIGATSGIGYHAAQIFLEKGYSVGLGGRRTERLEPLLKAYPHNVVIQRIDVNAPCATDSLEKLIELLGGMDIILISAGIGFQNEELNMEKEMATVQTNALGFVGIAGYAFRYFEQRGGGHIAAISSIAGTKGLGAAPAYSATKRFQNTYLSALAQLSHTKRANIRITDLRPGFVDTSLIAGRSYPMLMSPERTARTIVRAVERKRRIVVIDVRYRLLVFLWRAIPRAIWERLNIK